LCVRKSWPGLWKTQSVSHEDPQHYSYCWALNSGGNYPDTGGSPRSPYGLAQLTPFLQTGKERFYRWTGNTVQFSPANVSRIRPALIARDDFNLVRVLFSGSPLPLTAVAGDHVVFTTLGCGNACPSSVVIYEIQDRYPTVQELLDFENG